MDKISQLMDGELGRRESKAQIARLESDVALARSWEAYHVIRDALRHEAELPPDFSHRLHERLMDEPTVIAPHTRLAHRAVRYTLPLAAGVAGVTLVAWLALQFQEAGRPGSPMVASRQPAADVGTARPPAAGVADASVSNGGAVNDYLTAHQEFSPSTAMQGLASYVRTVSTGESNAR
jgi:sigma-E factor negative regulatory protein RseA